MNIGSKLLFMWCTGLVIPTPPDSRCTTMWLNILLASQTGMGDPFQELTLVHVQMFVQMAENRWRDWGHLIVLRYSLNNTALSITLIIRPLSWVEFINHQTVENLLKHWGTTETCPTWNAHICSPWQKNILTLCPNEQILTSIDFADSLRRILHTVIVMWLSWLN
jgi:hypothetical protein